MITTREIQPQLEHSPHVSRTIRTKKAHSQFKHSSHVSQCIGDEQTQNMKSLYEIS
jgi:hypothetical protein